jgi:hypothetical protein
MLTVTAPAIATITVTPASPMIAVSSTQQFTATAKDSSGNTVTGATFTWASSATSVATVSAGGLATGVASGTTQITAAASGVTSAPDSLQVTTPVTASVVTGTASMGLPIANAVITLKDSAGQSVSGTTASDGTYSLTTTGMTPPFLIQVQATSGNVYSVSADALATTTVNAHVLSDLVIRSWYSAQGQSIDTAFSNPVTLPAPSASNVQIVANAVVQSMQLWLNNASVDTTHFNMISTPFIANGTGFDSVLHDTTVNVGTGTVTVSDGTTTQTSTITYNTGSSMMTINSSTTNANGTSSESQSVVVPTQTAQQTAVSSMTNQVVALCNIINTQGGQLAASDLTSLLAPDLLNDGLNQTQFAASLATDLRGNTIAAGSVQVQAIKNIDLVNQTADIVFNLTLTQGSVSQPQMLEQFFKNEGGTWLIWGDRTIGKFMVSAEALTNQGSGGNSNGPAINAGLESPQGAVTSVTITDASGTATTQSQPWSAFPLPQNATTVDTFSPTPTTTLIVNLDQFDQASDFLTSLIPAGTLFTFAVTPASGPVTNYTLPSNAFTTEAIFITAPTSSSLASYTLGQPFQATWTLPTTFAISEVKLSVLAFTGLQSNPSTLECNTEQSFATTATSGMITIPATCAGQPVANVNLNLNVNGVNGERALVIFFLQ